MVDNSDKVNGNIKTKLLLRVQWQWYDKLQHETNQLYGKQRHTGFNYYEYDMPKFVILSWAQSSLDRSRLNSRGLEDPEHDHARHQGIHGHGRGQTSYTNRVRPVTCTIIVYGISTNSFC